jgi:putative endonuclease
MMKGAAEEELAHRYLLKQGLKPIARNWRCAGGEIDLVMRTRDTLVIVEVRKRSREDFGDAASSVDARKRARVIHAARMFLAQQPEYAELSARFDMVTLDRVNRINWIKAAFDTDG